MAGPPPIVFLPGLLETSPMWRPARVQLGLEPGQVLAPDLPGHAPGDTPAGTRQALGTGAWLDRLAERIARRFGGRPAMVVGHSSGGMLAIALARRHPGTVARLCVINGLTGLPRAGRFGLRRRLLLADGIGGAAFAALWRLWLATPATFDRGFRPSAAGPLRLPAARPMRRHLLACDPMAVRETARWVARSDVGGDLARVEVPVLALIGRSDPVVPPRCQLEIVRRAPNAHARLLDGGHLLPMEAPGAVHRALAAWRYLTSAASAPREVAHAAE